MSSLANLQLPEILLNSARSASVSTERRQVDRGRTYTFAYPLVKLQLRSLRLRTENRLGGLRGAPRVSDQVAAPSEPKGSYHSCTAQIARIRFIKPQALGSDPPACYRRLCKALAVQWNIEVTLYDPSLVVVLSKGREALGRS